MLDNGLMHRMGILASWSLEPINMKTLFLPCNMCLEKSKQKLFTVDIPRKQCLGLLSYFWHLLKSECFIVRRSNRIIEDVTLNFRKDLSKFVIVLEGTRKWYITSQVQVRMQQDCLILYMDINIKINRKLLSFLNNERTFLF